MHNMAEYIWMDGGNEDSPVQTLRSKTRVLDRQVIQDGTKVILETFPTWGFDGSSTNQSEGSDSDLVLKPVCFVNDPIRGTGNYLVLCEVMNADGTPHKSNTRAKLANVLADGASAHEPWFGFEQEYTLYSADTERPLGWPAKGLPAREQGPYYCGVGADEVAGRPLVEEHLLACLKADIMIYGTNAEVMLGQWEFQIGHRGFDSGKEEGTPLLVADHLWLSRWLLYRLGENHGIAATLDCKPEKGDWNGAGCHTNFSTKSMRDKTDGAEAIKVAIAKIGEIPSEHIAEYGYGLEDRLTGKHETCSISEFKSGVSDRTASIRIPRHVHEQGYGYLEDRRPGANCDPYRVAARILQTVCLPQPVRA
jgi:glutamine synthetase